MKQLYSKDQIAASVADVARQISDDYRDKEILLIVVLKGAMFFAADLARQIDGDVSIDFMRVTSYGADTCSCGNVTLKVDLETDICDKHVIVVEDIVDTGLTLHELIKHLKTYNPATLKICTLIDKPERRVVEVSVDYCGMEIDNYFIVGYGLDLDEKYRNLDAIYLFDPAQQQSTTGDS